MVETFHGRGNTPVYMQAVNRFNNGTTMSGLSQRNGVGGNV